MDGGSSGNCGALSPAFAPPRRALGLRSARAPRLHGELALSGSGASERPSDAELVTLSLNGMERAFACLIERHARHLHRLVSRRLRNPEDVLDVLQDTHFSVWRALRTYDAQRPFEAWLTSIALNKCRDWARHRRVHLGLMTRMQADAAHGGTSTVERSAECLVIDRERMREVGRALYQLAQPLREPLMLTTVQELPQADAARMLGLTRKAVEMRVRRARECLERALTDDCAPRRGRRDAELQRSRLMNQNVPAAAKHAAATSLTRALGTA